MSADAAGVTALLDAVKRRDTGAVTALLEGDPGLVDARDGSGMSPVTMAIYVRAEDVLELLLARGATVYEPKPPRWRTPRERGGER